MSRDRRHGLRVRGDRGHPEVARAMIQYARWLRTQYAFPVRLPVYLSPAYRLMTVSGEVVCASFFYPFDSGGEPYIRIATGDFEDLVAEMGTDDALATMLRSFSHEIIHYHQWLDSGSTSERGVPARAAKMVDRDAQCVDCP